MNNLTVSIVTATYNSGNFIERCMKTVAEQSCLNNIEHIIVDGRSTDSTLSIVSSFQHVKKIISENDRGIYHAFNKGLSVATGDIVYFLNSDDYLFDSNVISDVIDVFLSDDNIDFVAAKVLAVNPETGEEKLIPFGENNEVLQKKPCHQGFFCRRKIFEELGCFNECFSISADKYFMKQVMSSKIGLYSDKVVAYYQLGGFSSRDISKFRLEEFLTENLLGERVIPVSEYYENISSKVSILSCLRSLFFRFLRNEISVENLKHERIAIFGAHELSIIFYEALNSMDIETLGMFVTDFSYLTLDCGYDVVELEEMKACSPSIIINCVEGASFEQINELLESEFKGARVLDWKSF